MSEVNCLNCKIGDFKNRLCEKKVCERFSGEGSQEDFIALIPRWIPCSERLPSGQEEVIVSCHDDSGDTSYDYTTCGWVTNDGEYWIADNEINSHVVAWMPLPTPYERKEE